MEQQETLFFQSELTHDIQTHNELSTIALLTNTTTLISRIVLIAIFLFYIFNFHLSGLYVYFYLGIVAFSTITDIVRYFKNKNGNLQYKRMLEANHGQPVRKLCTFTENGVLEVNPDTGNRYTTAYPQFVRILETEHFLLLLTKYRQYSPVRKDSLTGGTREDFLSFLACYCPNLKSKDPSKGTFGKVIAWILVITMIIGTIAAIFNFPGLYLWERITGRIGNHMSYQQIAEELTELGITGVDRELIATIEADYQHYPQHLIDQLGKTEILLSYLGEGEFDKSTYTWTPSSDCVYWFSAEAWSPSNLLQGISAISDGELAFFNIDEDYSQMDWYTISGTCTVEFDWNDQRYTLHAQVDGDWIDVEAVDQLAEIVADGSSDRQLYFADDNGPGFIVFYRDAQWAEEFQDRTGIRLYTSTAQIYELYE